MSNEDTTVSDVLSDEAPEADFSIVIKLSDKNLSYKSDFTEAETIFWLEAVKGLVMQSTFEKADLHKVD
jgi:hypothetical protein